MNTRVLKTASILIWHNYELKINTKKCMVTQHKYGVQIKMLMH